MSYLYHLDTAEACPKGYRTFVLYPDTRTADRAFCAIAAEVTARLCGEERVLTSLAYEKRPGIFSKRRTLPSVELFSAFGLEKEIFGGKGVLYTVTNGYNAPLARLVTEEESTVGRGFLYTAYVIDREMPHCVREVRLMHRYPDYRRKIKCDFTRAEVEISLREDERALLFEAVRMSCAGYGKAVQQRG